jgi:DNA polymerase III epsilon subunit-like protein
MLGDQLLRFNLDKKPILVFDTETEGLNLAYSRPWQVSWSVYLNNKEIEAHNHFLKWPNLKVSEGAAINTGFQQSVIDEKGEDPKAIIELFEKYLYDEKYLICGANILGYDVMVLNHCRKSFGKPSDYSYIKRCYDTNALSKAYKQSLKIKDADDFVVWQFKMLNTRIKGMRTNVGAMCEEFGIPFEEEKRHDAIYDNLLTYQVFKKLIYAMDII